MSPIAYFAALMRDGLFQRETALERAGLLARPGADAAVARAAGEIGVGRRLAHRLDRPAHPHLTAQRLPVEEQGGAHVRRELRSLGAFGVGVEHEALFAPVLEQHHAHVGQARGVDRRERHRFRIVELLARGLGKPLAKQREGLRDGLEVT